MQITEAELEAIEGLLTEAKMPHFHNHEPMGDEIKAVDALVERLRLGQYQTHTGEIAKDE